MVRLCAVKVAILIFGSRIEKEYFARRDDFFNVARRVVSAPVKQEVVSSFI